MIASTQFDLKNAFLFSIIEETQLKTKSCQLTHILPLPLLYLASKVTVRTHLKLQNYWLDKRYPSTELRNEGYFLSGSNGPFNVKTDEAAWPIMGHAIATTHFVLVKSIKNPLSVKISYKQCELMFDWPYRTCSLSLKLSFVTTSVQVSSLPSQQQRDYPPLPSPLFPIPTHPETSELDQKQIEWNNWTSADVTWARPGKKMPWYSKSSYRHLNPKWFSLQKSRIWLFFPLESIVSGLLWFSLESVKCNLADFESRIWLFFP